VLVVGFDTATPAVSVALHDGERVVSEASAADGRRHGELLTPMIAQVLSDAGASRADLTAVAVGVGPGPYTGLRVGVVTARVLGAVLGIPVHGVCSLDVIAADVPRGREFLVATDARRKEVYWARYDASGARLEGPRGRQRRVDPRCRRIGRGGQRGTAVPGGVRRGHRARLSGRPDAVRARGRRARRAGRRAPAGAEPLYLRRPDAREPGPPKKVTPPTSPEPSS
jgi:tRNA threonylcarbamoyl adenosine modification protein YeaZ